MGGPGSIPNSPKFVCEVSIMGFIWVGLGPAIFLMAQCLNDICEIGSSNSMPNGKLLSECLNEICKIFLEILYILFVGYLC